MTEASQGNQPRQWKLFIRRRGSATQGTPPGKDELKWVANTTTLIHGEQDALLVDTFLSEAQTGELADWIAAGFLPLLPRGLGCTGHVDGLVRRVDFDRQRTDLFLAAQRAIVRVARNLALRRGLSAPENECYSE